MAREGFGRIKYFKRSGARLYIPEKLIRDSAFPFEDEDVVKITIGSDSLTLGAVEWWELLDWKGMPDAFKRLPEEVKEKIKKAELI